MKLIPARVIRVNLQNTFNKEEDLKTLSNKNDPISTLNNSNLL